MKLIQDNIEIIAMVAASALTFIFIASMWIGHVQRFHQFH